MAVHHFTAPDLIVTRGWQPIGTFPRDGSVVEVKDAENHVVQAFWKDDVIAVGGKIGDLTHWRNLE
jgi:hypothetical protein